MSEEKTDKELLIEVLNDLSREKNIPIKNLNVKEVQKIMKEKYGKDVSVNWIYRTRKKITPKVEVAQERVEGVLPTEPTVTPVPPTAQPEVAPEEAPPEAKPEISTMTPQDCSDLYGAGLEAVSYVRWFKNPEKRAEFLKKMEDRIKIQGERLYRIFLKYNIKFEFALEVLFGLGVFSDFGTFIIDWMNERKMAKAEKKAEAKKVEVPEKEKEKIEEKLEIPPTPPIKTELSKEVLDRLAGKVSK